MEIGSPASSEDEVMSVFVTATSVDVNYVAISVYKSMLTLQGLGTQN